MAAYDEISAARRLAVQHLPLWAEGCRLHHSAELSTPDVLVFRVISPAGRHCGVVMVTAGGAVLNRRPAPCDTAWMHEEHGAVASLAP